MCVCVLNIKNFYFYFKNFLSEFDRLKWRKISLFSRNLFQSLYLQKLATHFLCVMNYIFTVLYTWMFGLKQGSEDLRRLGKHPVLLDLRHYHINLRVKRMMVILHL